jgi:hypothetical protein
MFKKKSPFGMILVSAIMIVMCLIGEKIPGLTLSIFFDIVGWILAIIAIIAIIIIAFILFCILSD